MNPFSPDFFVFFISLAPFLLLLSRQIVSDETNVYDIKKMLLDEFHKYVTVSQNFPLLVLINTLKIIMESNLRDA